jgi:hypothetical protein
MTHTCRFGRRAWPLAVVLLLPGAFARGQIISLTATLNGTQEVPPNASTGVGGAAFSLNTTTGTMVSAVTIPSTTPLTSPLTSATINQGAPGQIGPILHNLTVSTVLGQTSGSFTDIWTGITPAQITALVTGNAYINITSNAFPAGEIRGQITTAVPEPGALTMVAGVVAAVTGGAWLRRRRRSPA